MKRRQKKKHRSAIAKAEKRLAKHLSGLTPLKTIARHIISDQTKINRAVVKLKKAIERSERKS
jgi:hypothetical protein